MGRRDVADARRARRDAARAVSSRGPLAEAASRHVWLASAIPIGAVIGDQQSALYGQRAVSPGAAKATFGTGAFLLMHTGQRASPRAIDY